MENRPFWMPDIPTMIVSSLLVIFGFVIAMLMLAPMPMTESAGTLVTAMIGMLTASISMIVSFYFGSSKSSQAKDETTRLQAETLASAAKTTNGTTPKGP